MALKMATQSRGMIVAGGLEVTPWTCLFFVTLRERTLKAANIVMKCHNNAESRIIAIIAQRSFESGHSKYSQESTIPL